MSEVVNVKLLREFKDSLRFKVDTPSTNQWSLDCIRYMKRVASVSHSLRPEKTLGEIYQGLPSSAADWEIEETETGIVHPGLALIVFSPAKQKELRELLKETDFALPRNQSL